MPKNTAKTKVTASTVIRDGIAKGWTVDRILKTCKEKVPTSNADTSHVLYYANEQHRKGNIDDELRDKYINTRKVANPKASRKADIKKAAVAKGSGKKDPVAKKKVKKIVVKKK